MESSQRGGGSGGCLVKTELWKDLAHQIGWTFENISTGFTFVKMLFQYRFHYLPKWGGTHCKSDPSCQIERSRNLINNEYKDLHLEISSFKGQIEKKPISTKLNKGFEQKASLFLVTGDSHDRLSFDNSKVKKHLYRWPWIKRWANIHNPCSPGTKPVGPIVIVNIHQAGWSNQFGLRGNPSHHQPATWPKNLHMAPSKHIFLIKRSSTFYEYLTWPI